MKVPDLAILCTCKDKDLPSLLDLSSFHGDGGGGTFIRRKRENIGETGPSRSMRALEISLAFAEYQHVYRKKQAIDNFLVPTDRHRVVRRSKQSLLPRKKTYRHRRTQCDTHQRRHSWSIKLLREGGKSTRVNNSLQECAAT